MTKISVQIGDNGDGKPQRDELVTPKQIREAAQVGARTVRRWADRFDWRTVRLNQRVIRYSKSDVEATLGVTLS